MGALTKTTQHVIDPSVGQGFATTRAQDLLAWAQKYSLFMYPYVTACCGMEFMAATSPRYDLARFGAEAPRFSPRQSDLLWVVGTIVQRQAPVLKRIYEQMAEPKWVLAFGTCASCGGFYDNYATVAGIDKIIPCDVYIPGCPPRPEAVFDGLMLLQDKIQRGDRTPAIVKPRLDPVTQPGMGVVPLRKSRSAGPARGLKG
ncbi:MAG TPA: NADH-quinone oxidoreductase subunit NuoB [Polyangiaceae bacterium]